MRRRWRLWLPLLIVLFGGAAFFHPAIYWPVMGWLRGESFYQGWPTSYWRNEVCKWDPPQLGVLTGGTGAQRRPTFREELSARWGRSVPEPDSSKPPLLQGDRAALPVLIEMLRDEDPRIVNWAVYALLAIGPEAKSTFPLLRELSQDAREDIDFYAVSVAILSFVSNRPIGTTE